MPHITDVCDRFAQAGFTALAPDLFRGESTTEPDEAGKLMMALNVEAASNDMEASIEIHPGVDHAFFNDTRPEVYSAQEAAKAWDDTITFFGENLG